MVEEISGAKGEGAVDHITLIKWLKKFVFAKVEGAVDQSTVSRSKSVDSKVVLHAKEACLVSSTQRVQGELSISLFTVVGHFHPTNELRKVT